MAKKSNFYKLVLLEELNLSDTPFKFNSGKGNTLEIFKIQVDEIILPLVADGFLSIGWVPMSYYSFFPKFN